MRGNVQHNGGNDSTSFRCCRSYTMLYDSGPKNGPFSNGTAGFPANANCSNGWGNGCPPAWLFRNRNEWCVPLALEL